MQTSALPTRAVPLLRVQTVESALSFLLMHHVLREVRGTDGPSRSLPLLLRSLQHASMCHVQPFTVLQICTQQLSITTVAWLHDQQSTLRLYGVS